MPVIPFSEWLPDQADYQNPGVIKATNVFPSTRGYLPVPEYQSASTALDARARGAAQVRDKDLNVRQYAGDASKLYENVSNTWTDRSKTGGYSTASDEIWEFAKWENKILATNFSDSPQQITLGDSAFSDLTTALRARHISVIRDFVVFANTFDSTDGNVPNRVRWSAINDETDYTVSASTLSDFQDLKTSPVERVFGGEFGVVMQKNAIWRMTFVGSPTVFQFDEVLPGVGLISSGAAVQDGDVIYFLSDRGFYRIVNGSDWQPIGAEKVDQFVLDDLDNDHELRISAAVDPTSKRIFWAYPGAGNTGGRPNKIVVYDQFLNKWSILEQEVQIVYSAGGLGQTLEDLDSVNSSVDALPASLDSRRWVGGAALLSAFDENNKSGSFDGASNMTATIGTKEFEIHSGHRTHLNAFRPVIDGGTVTAKVGTRNRQADTVSFSSSLSLSSTGRFTCRENARYHRFEFTITGDWSHAVGTEIEPHEARKGEKRG